MTKKSSIWRILLMLLGTSFASFFGACRQANADGTPSQFIGSYSYQYYSSADAYGSISVKVDVKDIVLKRTTAGIYYLDSANVKYKENSHFDHPIGSPYKSDCEEVTGYSISLSVSDKNCIMSVSIGYKGRESFMRITGPYEGDKVGVFTKSVEFPLVDNGKVVTGDFYRTDETNSAISIKETAHLTGQDIDDGCGVADITCSPDIIRDVNKGKDYATIAITRPTSKCTKAKIDGGKRSDGKNVRDPYPIGTTIITWTATNPNKQTATCDQKITVNAAYKPLIGVDFNRDGSIDYDKTDKTSAAQPYRFWLNDDHDFYDADLEDETDADPTTGKDYADDRIALQRDLEDFTRLHIEAPTDFRPDGTWRCTLNFLNPTGSPGIRLWRAVSPDNKYLTDRAVSLKQTSVGIGISNPGPANWIIGASEQEIPISLFKSIGGNRYQGAFLFEGMSAGQGALQVHFYKSGSERTAENPAWVALHSIRDFYDYYSLPSVSLTGVTTNYTTRTAAAAINKAQSPDYILFVHGWRMQEWNKQSFAETAFKRLWHRGYRGKFGLFSWPTEYVEREAIPWSAENRRNYDRSERVAWLSAAGLRRVLTALNSSYPQRVRVLAHSMGNVVASEALLQESESQNSLRLVHTYVATQAATVAQSYDAKIATSSQRLLPNVYLSYPLTSRPYFDGSKNNGGLKKAAGRLVNYFNARDDALSFVKWQINQRTKPDSGFSGVGYNYRPNGSKKGFYRGNTLLNFPTDRYEIFAHAAPAQSLALGAQSVGSQFSANLNLETSFGFTGKASDHSAQFNSNLMTRLPYWEKLMTDFGISFTLPK